MRDSHPAGPLPNLFIIGTAKAGTTALHIALDAHPDIAMSEPKEPHWFISGPEHGGSDRARNLPGAQTFDEREYRALFRDAATTWRGESTVGYLAHPEVPARIAAACPESRFVAVLRDPVERCISAWRFWHAHGVEPLDLAAALRAEDDDVPLPNGNSRRYMRGGMYSAQVARWHAHLPKSALLLLEYGDWRSKPQAAVRAVTDFLDLPTHDFDAGERNPSPAPPRSRLARRVVESERLRATERAGIPVISRGAGTLRSRLKQWNKGAWPPVDPAIRRALQERYGDEVARLQPLVPWNVDRWTDHWRDSTSQ